MCDKNIRMMIKRRPQFEVQLPHFPGTCTILIRQIMVLVATRADLMRYYSLWFFIVPPAFRAGACSRMSATQVACAGLTVNDTLPMQGQMSTVDGFHESELSMAHA